MASLTHDLENELAGHQRGARNPRCVAAIDALNLRIDAAPWGVGFVEINANIYEPSEAGEAALIFAAEAGGELVDLVACRLRDRATATRKGIAAVLGEDALETACITGQRLLLYRDALAWAHCGFYGITILDWTRARCLLADVPDIACSNADVASRVHAALAAPAPMPRLFVASAA